MQHDMTLITALHIFMNDVYHGTYKHPNTQVNVINRASTGNRIHTLAYFIPQDFEEIFMSGGIKCVTDPDHNEFIR